MIRFFTLAFLVHSVASDCCAPGGIWSEWVEDLTTCYDYCGGVGSMTRTRSCLNGEACPCMGMAAETVSCDTFPCYSPRNHTCAPGKTLQVVSGAFQCLPPNTPTILPIPLLPNLNCPCCPTGGIWGEWTDNGACSDSCGACGKINRTRTCLTAPYGCNCAGSSTALQTCSRAPCVGRTQACCAGTVLTILPNATTCQDTVAVPRVEKADCCPSSLGLWNQWSSWTTCTATCGLCGARTRTRTCASQPYGFNCTGDTLQVSRCGGVACPGSTCCTGFLTKSYDGTDLCLAAKPAITPTGTFSSWTAVTGSSCSDTCGGFGTIPSYRYCLPVGSSCSGTFFGSAPCGFNVCLGPRQSCAPGYKKTIVGNTFQCTSTAN